jgi:hypothetical protein
MKTGVWVDLARRNGDEPEYVTAIEIAKAAGFAGRVFGQNGFDKNRLSSAD